MEPGFDVGTDKDDFDLSSYGDQVAAINNEDIAGVDEDPNGGNHYYSGDVDWVMHDLKRMKV